MFPTYDMPLASVAARATGFNTAKQTMSTTTTTRCWRLVTKMAQNIGEEARGITVSGGT